MTDVAEILDSIAPEEPVADRWREVLHDADRPGHRRRLTVAAIALAIAVIAAGTATALRSLVLISSPRDGMFVERAGALELRAEVGACGAALYIYRDGARLASSSGIPVRGVPRCRLADEQHSVGWTAGGGAGTTYVAGLVAPDVQRLVVIPDHGPPLEPRLVRAPDGLATSVRFFFAELERPRSHRGWAIPVRAFVTYDGAGRLIEHWNLPALHR